MIQAKALCAAIGANQVLRDVSLEIAPGELFAVIGANGAGKTSLLRALSGLLPLQSGAITFEGRNIARVPAHRLSRSGLVHVPQGRQIIPGLTVRDNLEIGAQNVGLSRHAIAARLDEQWERFPVLRQRQSIDAAALSGGEQQMLAIGRALMTRPQLLMIDEISLGLMPKAIELCYRALEVLRREGLTILLVEQNTDRVLRVADDLCVLESGRTVWQGTAAAARQDPTLTAAYLGMH